MRVALYLIAASAAISIGEAQQLTSKYFDVKIIDASRSVWDDKGSGAERSVSIWQPAPPAGYYTFGHMLSKEHNPRTKPSTIAVKPKPGFENLLAAPTGYEEVWNDAGSGANRDVKIFKANCPGGYEALGMLASNGTPRPSDGSFRCISRNKQADAVLIGAQYLSEDKSGKKGVWDDKKIKVKRALLFSLSA